MNTEIIYPAEIFIGMLAAVFMYGIVFQKQNFFFPDKVFLKHPLSFLVIFYLLINMVSALFSTMHVVSLKAVAVKSCYILVFYFMMHALIKSSFQNFSKMIAVYGFSLALVTAYSLAAHYQYGLNRNTAAFMTSPFFNDHTIFAAALAFIIPAFISFSFFSNQFEISRTKRMLVFAATILFITGIYYSFSRAAWISIIAAFFLFVLIKKGVQFYGLLLLSLLFLCFAWFNRHSIINSFKENKIDSNVADAGLYEQVFSLTNITSDASNAERLNRWKCAVRMFLDKPVLGFGPGTFQFKYIPYQKKEEMSIISITKPIESGATTYSWSPQAGLNLPTNASFIQGNGGTAHSEYFLELSEGGIFSFLTFTGFFIISVFTGLKIFSKSTDKKIKITALFTLLGLVTYFVHGLFNNFLNDCKLGFLFWSSLSTLAALDVMSIYRSENEKTDQKDLIANNNII